MRTRRIMVAIEVETDLTTQELKRVFKQHFFDYVDGYLVVHQTQVNVIKKEKEVKK